MPAVDVDECALRGDWSCDEPPPSGALIRSIGPVDVVMDSYEQPRDGVPCSPWMGALDGAFIDYCVRSILTHWLIACAVAVGAALGAIGVTLANRYRAWNANSARPEGLERVPPRHER